jgi:glycosyltransferase involved in cell wall biosynthesis
MSKVIVVYSPYELKQNKYIEIMQSLIDQNGFEIHSLSQFFSQFYVLRKSRIIHLNWYENIEGENLFSIWVQLIKKSIILLTLKLLRKKIVWTMHNRLPHDSKSGQIKKLFLILIIKISDRIVIHSKVSEIVLACTFPNLKNIKSKIRYIPHPDYIESYGRCIQTSNDDKRLNILFLGMIRKYKNIELLIDVLKSFDNRHVHLQIIGNYNSEDYIKKILEYSSSINNITLETRFIPDDEISQILSMADLLIAPYDIESSLNSGTLILAFSYKKTVICPKIGTIQDLINLDNVLTYFYNNSEEHFQELHKTIEKAINMKQQNKDIFKIMGERMYDEIVETNSKELVKAKLQSLYFELI